MSEWKTIDSAPKDGTTILIWNKDYDFAPLARWGEKDGCDENEAHVIFEGWHIINDKAPCCSVDDSFLGWEEDKRDGFMPTYWSLTPKQ